jgi:amino acid adenylation domain-containing protein
MKNVEDVYTLSPTQEGILAQSLYAEKPDIYFRQMTCSLHGNLQVEALRQAWQQVLDGHSILRTAFVWEGLESPLQIVRRRVTLPWQQLDWRSVSSAEQEKRLAAFLDEDQERGFELSQAPLMRLALAQLADERYRLIWSDHHLLLDGWSKSLLFKELLLRYEALSRERQAGISPSRPFSDYIAWLKRQNMSEGEAFWRAKLKGFSAPTPLGVERIAAGRAKEKRYDTRYLHFTTDETATVQAFARRQSLTLNTLVQAAWAVLLSRYSGEEDVVFGAVVAGRPAELEGAEQLVGIFINILPVRARVSPQSRLRPWLREIQEAHVASRRYEFISLAQIHGWSEVARATPLFQSIVIFQNYPIDASLTEKRNGLEIHNFNFVESTDFPLTLEAGVLASQFFLKIIYDCALLDLDAVNGMMSHLKNLILSMCAGAEQQQLSDLQLLSNAERHQLLVEWNATAAEFPASLCFHQLFEAQVARTPEASAVACKEGRLTYLELERRANRLARRLVLQGVGPEAVVAVLAERGGRWTTALLGIFKAGGVYLPLDPLHPAQRLAQVLEQSEAALVLVTQSLRASLMHALGNMPEDARPQVFSIEELLSQKESEEPLGARSSPSEPAYVIFTSGSTGKPKGAVIEHAGMLNHLYIKVLDLKLTHRDVVAQTASQCFDISVWQLLAPLLVGAQVRIIEDDSAHDPSALPAEIERGAVTILETVPSLLQAMLEQAEKVETALRPQFSSLRWMIVTGEALPAELCRRWLNLYPQTPLLNAYGPTECSDDVTHHVIERSPSAETTQVPIGRPVANTQMYVLDRMREPVPVGVNGELYVGGIGVGRGYLHDPLRTAEAFVPDPYGGRSGARLYRTGDVGRYLSDGTIEFLGRLDHQVKVRGFRIELGEVEAALTTHAAVRAAVVTAHEPEGGAEKRLVAYVVAGQDERPTTDSLREHVGQHLPEYMIPSAFVMLEELPLSLNGKVDRRALPAPDQARDGAKAYVAPRTPVEELVAGIWAEVLKVERVGVADDFFDLGGHSLLATQVISRLRTVFAVELPVRSIFEHPTVARLAQRIVAVMPEEQRPVAPPISPVARGVELPLSFAQQRLWFLNQLEPGNPFYNVGAAIRVTGALDVTALADSLNEVIRRHEVLRTTFASTEGHPRQVIAPAGTLKFVVAELDELTLEERERETLRLAREEAQRDFDLSEGPLLRVTLLRMGEHEHVMLFTMHHIISDGWSIGLLVKEVSVLYRAFIEGRPSPLPELSIQYADFAVWQREWLGSERIETQIDYWRKHLYGAPPVLKLRTGTARPAGRSYRGATAPVTVESRLSRALKELSLEAGATLFMTLLAAWQVLLRHHSGQDEIVVGTPIANRNRAEIEELIGFFVNTLVLRTSIRGEMSFRELLGHVREVTLGAHAHQDVPFELLVERLQPVRSLEHSPLFQVMFVFQNQQPVMELPGLTLAPMEIERTTARHDLKLDLTKSPEGLSGFIEYRLDLFDAAMIEGLARQLLMILEEVSARPDRTLDSLGELLAEVDMQLPAVREKEFREASRRKFQDKRRKVINL